jgi:hypothetical protein
MTVRWVRTGFVRRIAGLSALGYRQRTARSMDVGLRTGL